MLLKFDSIEEIGRFAKLTHRAEAFARLALVYARNGYGKSTLSAILRSASEREPNQIHQRRRLSATGECRVQTSWASGVTVAFGGGNWNSCPGTVHVFDQEYVFRNLHVGDSVTRENKRSLLPVVLGEEGVRLSQAILNLDREQRDIETASRGHSKTILAGCRGISGDQLLTFCNAVIPADLGERTEASVKRVTLAEQSVAVQQKRPLKQVPLISLDDILEILARTIESVSRDAEDRVRLHFEAHDFGRRGDAWIEFGLEHMPDGDCPFCGQQAGHLDLISAYQTHFSEAFAKLSADRDQAINAVDDIAKEGELANIVQQNADDLGFWSRVCELPHMPSFSTGQVEAAVAGLQALRAALHRKQAAPLERISLDDREAEIAACFADIAAYNAAIEECGDALDTARQSATNVNLVREQETLAKWRALHARQSDPVRSAAAAFAEGEARRAAIVEEKKTAQAALTDYAKRTMDSRQRQINALLEDFGASFSIIDAKANFRGREPNTDYAISVAGHKIPAGERSDTDPSFKTVLSAGDKTTLALALFLTQVRADPNIADAVVVFDDPFNSQDMARQHETAVQIRAVAALSCQTLVLSHDPRFLFQIEKDAIGIENRSFQLQCSDDGVGRIAQWSASDELQTVYVRQAEIIRAYASQGVRLGNATASAIKQSIRPFLEDYIKLRFPGRFVNGEQISGMVTVIREAGNDDPMFAFADDLTALNEYTRTDMHGGADNPDLDQLRAQAKKVIRIVGSY